TSKGRFLVVDGIDVSVYGATFVAKLSEITEEQASEIVEESLDSHLYTFYKCYNLNEVEEVEWEDDFIYTSAIDSLHSLLKSKGIHLFENPFYHGDLEDYTKYKEAEQKTFYN